MNKTNEVLKHYENGDELEIVFQLPTSTSIQKFGQAVVSRYPKFSKDRKAISAVTTRYEDGTRVRVITTPSGSTTEMTKKRRKQQSVFSDGFKLSVSTEPPLPADHKPEGAIVSRRTMQRLSIKIDTQWVLELSSVITESTSGQPVETLELEVEYIGVTPPSAEVVTNRLNDIRVLVTDFGIELDVDFDSKLNYVYAVYRGEDPRTFRNFAPGIKGINNVITLKPHTWRELLSDPTNIVITDKVDGIRKIIYSDSNFIYILNNKNDFKHYNYPIGFEFIADAEEYTDPNTGQITYFIFDIYKLKSVNYKGRSFTKKMDGITRVYEELKAIDLTAAAKGATGLPIKVAIKKFVELRGKWRDVLTTFVAAPKPYVTDGFIIIDNRANVSYKYKPENTVDFFLKKASPTGGTNGEPNEYVLMCTINQDYFDALALPGELLDDIPEEFRPARGKPQGEAPRGKSQGEAPRGKSPSFPIPFVSALETSVEVSSYTFDDDEDHDGKIGEFTWVPNNRNDYSTGGKWAFHKFRTDRIVSSSYYGNHYKVAESNFSMDMINFDITEDIGGYFNTSNKKAQENVRRYTNLVMKQMLFDKLYGVLGAAKVGLADSPLEEANLPSVKGIKTIPGGVVSKLLANPRKDISRVPTGTSVTSVTSAHAPQKRLRVDQSSFKLLDVSCGHGQDLNRYGNVKLVFGIDIDKNAIIEMIDRKLEGASRSKKPEPLLLAAIADVTKTPEETFALIERKHSSVEQYFTHSVCLLAFHYFCNDATTMGNALGFISRSLKKGGRFGIILYDGKKIRDLMDGKKMTTQFPFGEEMCLRKNYDQYSKFGSKIGVRLPFSGDAFYEENIVVINDHIKAFQEHDLYLVETIPFSDHFDNSVYKITDIHDKNYLSLYQCVIFEKK